MRNTFYPLVISVLILSCSKKTETTTSFPKTVSVTSLNKKGNLRMFVSGGEILDADLINKLAAQFNGLSTTKDATANLLGSISFPNKDTLKLIPSINPTTHVVQRNGTDFLFIGTKELSILSTDLTPYIQKYSQALVAAPASSGYAYTTKATMYATGDYNELSLSQLIYLIKRSTGTSSWSAEVKTLFNQFNPSVIQKLGIKDTLLIQEYIVDLK